MNKHLVDLEAYRAYMVRPKLIANCGEGWEEVSR